MKKVNVISDGSINCLMLIICICILPILVGCSTVQIKEYSYASVIKRFDWGTLNAKLIGSWSDEDGNNILGSPYDLAIWFIPNSNTFKAIEINNIKLIDINEDIVYENNMNVVKEFDGSNNFFFIYEKINIPYNDYNLIINYNLLGSGNNQNNNNIEISIKFKKKYKQRKINRLWQRLMSV